MLNILCMIFTFQIESYYWIKYVKLHTVSEYISTTCDSPSQLYLIRLRAKLEFLNPTCSKANC